MILFCCQSSNLIELISYTDGEGLGSSVMINYPGPCDSDTVTVTGNLLNTKVLTLVSRQLSQPVQSPSDMR
jgi:hypothetical protein